MGARPAPSQERGSAGYFIIRDLPPRSYVIATEDTREHVDELYDDIPCPPSDFLSLCDFGSGTPIPVALSESVTGIDFALDLGGSIEGRLVDAATGEPASDQRVEVWDSSGNDVGEARVEIDGRYRLGGLPTGTYFATSGGIDYVNELYDGLPCPGDFGCVPTTGTPIPVVLGLTTVDIDFELTLAGGISGFLTSVGSGEPIVDAAVDAWTEDGFRVASALTDETGAYQLDVANSDFYYVSTDAGGAFVDEVHARRVVLRRARDPRPLRRPRRRSDRSRPPPTAGHGHRL